MKGKKNYSKKIMSNNITYTKTAQRHGFHLVDPSPWPLATAMAALALTTAGVQYMHGQPGGGFVLSLAFISILLCTGCWWAWRLVMQLQLLRRR